MQYSWHCYQLLSLSHLSHLSHLTLLCISVVYLCCVLVLQLAVCIHCVLCFVCQINSLMLYLQEVRTTLLSWNLLLSCPCASIIVCTCIVVVIVTHWVVLAVKLVLSLSRECGVTLYTYLAKYKCTPKEYTSNIGQPQGSQWVKKHLQDPFSGYKLQNSANCLKTSRLAF